MSGRCPMCGEGPGERELVTYCHGCGNVSEPNDTYLRENIDRLLGLVHSSDPVDDPDVSRVNAVMQAAEALEIVHAVSQLGIPPLEHCLCPVMGSGGCSTCEVREAIGAARRLVDGHGQP